MRISPIPHIDGTLWYARADVEAAIAERDAEIERLRIEVEQAQSQARAWKEDAGRQAMFARNRPTPTLAEVAMHALPAVITGRAWDGCGFVPQEWATDAVSCAKALLAELERRGK